MGSRRKGGRLLLTGLAAGSGLTYFLDPDRGRRRRALLRDRYEHMRHETLRTTDVVIRDGRNRGRGLVAEAERLFRQEQANDDRIHHEVRARIAARSRHPHAIRVRVSDGRVLLTGPVLADEVEGVRSAVQRVGGIQSLEDRLEVHDAARDIPALQGEGRLGGPRPELLQTHWAPAPRATAGAVGGALMTYGIGRRGLAGLGIAACGGLLLTRAVTNRPLRQIWGVDGEAGAVHVDKQIDIDAPVDRIWSVLEDYERFPTFMSHVRDVREEENGWTHWTVDGPLGTAIEWDAELTDVRPNESLSWRSRPGAIVQHTGELSLQRFNGKSRMHISLDYSPPAGIAGHKLARLLGVDAKTQLDDDLLRMKTMLETGHRPRDAARH